MMNHARTMRYRTPSGARGKLNQSYATGALLIAAGADWSAGSSNSRLKPRSRLAPDPATRAGLGILRNPIGRRSVRLRTPVARRTPGGTGGTITPGTLKQLDLLGS